MVNNATNINKTNNLFTSQTNEHKKTLTYCVGNPGPDLGHAHKYGGGKPVNDISTTPLDK